MSRRLVELRMDLRSWNLFTKLVPVYDLRASENQEWSKSRGRNLKSAHHLDLRVYPSLRRPKRNEASCSALLLAYLVVDMEFFEYTRRLDA